MRLVSILLLAITLIFSCFELFGQGEMQKPHIAQTDEITVLRDSLDAVQYEIPAFPTIHGHWTVVKVRSQKDWDEVEPMMKALLDAGQRNIEVRITGTNIVFGREEKVIINWKYPNANIRIVGKKAKMLPYGYVLRRNHGAMEIQNGRKFWTIPYTEFDVNDIVIDTKGNEVPMRGPVRQVNGNIEKVQVSKNDNVIDNIWRFQIELPNISEEQCKDFYVLMTRDWTSARHKVVKVQDGWLYYHLDSEDLHSDRDPNVDWKQYRVRPRYRLINSPVSDGVHTADGKMYIPYQYKKIRVNKGGKLITFAYCHFNSLEISGFKLNGCNATPLGVYSSFFEKGGVIHDNVFSNMSFKAICTAINENVIISNNSIMNTRDQAIEGGGRNTTISGNHLKNIGWMLNTRAITGGGERLHICDNIIEDFNYCAIACGSRTPNNKAKPLTYIIERNIIRLSEEFTDNYIQNTLADGGGIYTGPQCTRGIIRNNVVENIKGIHSNRGIFLDDGAKNQAIYGNLVMKTANCYDIDLRYDRTFSRDIPDHNNNNCMFDNIMTGTYRFQDGGEESNCVVGNNLTVQDNQELKKLKRASLDTSTFLEFNVDEFICNYLKTR